MVCDSSELRDLVRGDKLLECYIASAKDISEMRAAFKNAVQALNRVSQRMHDLEVCATEAATNALKHAGSGSVALYVDGEDILVLVSDKGPGIAPVDFARAALEKGFSTRISLGMGFKIMWQLADKLAICTSEKGTQILIRINEQATNNFEQSILGRYSTRDIEEAV
jgi:anti-sigma regulatory factor (Ser/Thr protein kinase)